MNTNEFNIDKIRADFHILNNKINNHDLIYFDNAATTQKPINVINKIRKYYLKLNSNTHSHNFLSNKLEIEINSSRIKVQKFINSAYFEEIIFTKSATESINLVAYAIEDLIPKHSNVLVTNLEHHANYLPWKVLANRKNIEFRVADLFIKSKIELNNLYKLIDKNTKILALTQASNVLGNLLPIKKIVSKAKEINPEILVLVDASQSIPHIEIDVQDLGCDFLVFSGHKMLAPTGIGVLYGKLEILNQMKPFLTGGEMVESIADSNIYYKQTPYKFEAGTSNFEGILGIGEAINYIQNLKNTSDIESYHLDLKKFLLKQLNLVSKIKIISSDLNPIPIVSFYFENINSFDIATYLDLKGIVVRSGQMCCYPLFNKLKIFSALRVSLYIYNNKKEVEYLTKQLDSAVKFLS